jgi:nucleotide-binding universal stress UspA family protein
MFKHILIPTDGSAIATAALEKALDFARDIGAKVTVISVIQPLEAFVIGTVGTRMGYDEYERAVTTAKDATLNALLAAESRRMNSCKMIKAEAAEPADAIVAAAKAAGCDLIAMGSHGRSGLKALVLGSVTMKVMAHSTIPVLVYR